MDLLVGLGDGNGTASAVGIKYVSSAAAWPTRPTVTVATVGSRDTLYLLRAQVLEQSSRRVRPCPRGWGGGVPCVLLPGV